MKNFIQFVQDFALPLNLSCLAVILLTNSPDVLITALAVQFFILGIHMAQLKEF